MTITYILEGAGGADSGCTPALSNNEKALLTQTDAAAVSRSIPALTTDEIGLAWTTDDGPGSSPWPLGPYTSSLNVTTSQASASYKQELHRVNVGCTTQETLGTSSSQSGTGTKTFSTGDITPASGADADRYQLRLLTSNSASHGSKTVTITPTSVSFIDGPWTAATTPSHEYLVPFIGRRQRQRVRARIPYFPRAHAPVVVPSVEPAPPAGYADWLAPGIRRRQTDQARLWREPPPRAPGARLTLPAGTHQPSHDWLAAVLRQRRARLGRVKAPYVPRRRAPVLPPGVAAPPPGVSSDWLARLIHLQATRQARAWRAPVPRRPGARHTLPAGRRPSNDWLEALVRRQTSRARDKPPFRRTFRPPLFIPTLVPAAGTGNEYLFVVLRRVVLRDRRKRPDWGYTDLYRQRARGAPMIYNGVAPPPGADSALAAYSRRPQTQRILRM